MKILAIGAHTDDVELGCGGVLLDHVDAGHEVHVLALSACEETNEGADLRMEMHNSMEVLKPYGWICDVFEVRRFQRDRQAILDRLIYHRDRLQPDIVYSPSIDDIHQDHSTVSEEARRAFHKYQGDPDFNAFTHFEYHQWWNAAGAVPDTEITLGRYGNQKSLMIACYESQAHRFENFHMRYTHEHFSYVRGMSKL